MHLLSISQWHIKTPRMVRNQLCNAFPCKYHLTPGGDTAYTTINMYTFWFQMTYFNKTTCYHHLIIDITQSMLCLWESQCKFTLQAYIFKIILCLQKYRVTLQFRVILKYDSQLLHWAKCGVLYYLHTQTYSLTLLQKTPLVKIHMIMYLVIFQHSYV